MTTELQARFAVFVMFTIYAILVTVFLSIITFPVWIMLCAFTSMSVMTYPIIIYLFMSVFGTMDVRVDGIPVYTLRFFGLLASRKVY